MTKVVVVSRAGALCNLSQTRTVWEVCFLSKVVVEPYLRTHTQNPWQSLGKVSVLKFYFSLFSQGRGASLVSSPWHAYSACSCIGCCIWAQTFCWTWLRVSPPEGGAPKPRRAQGRGACAPLKETQNVFVQIVFWKGMLDALRVAATARGGDHAHVRGCRAPVTGGSQENRSTKPTERATGAASRRNAHLRKRRGSSGGGRH